MAAKVSKNSKTATRRGAKKMYKGKLVVPTQVRSHCGNRFMGVKYIEGDALLISEDGSFVKWSSIASEIEDQ